MAAMGPAMGFQTANAQGSTVHVPPTRPSVSRVYAAHPASTSPPGFSNLSNTQSHSHLGSQPDDDDSGPLASDGTSPKKESKVQPSVFVTISSAPKSRVEFKSWCLTTFKHFVKSDVFALALPPAQSLGDPHLEGIEMNMFRNTLRLFLGEDVYDVLWGPTAGGTGGRNIAAAVGERRRAVALAKVQSQREKRARKGAPQGFVMPGHTVEADSAEVNLTPLPAASKKKAGSANGRSSTPQFGKDRKDFFDYGLIINPNFVEGKGEDRVFNFAKLQLTDSYWNEDTRALFKALEYKDLRAFKWSFKSMYQKVSPAKRPALGDFGGGSSAGAEFPLVLCYDTSTLFEVHIIQLGGDTPGDDVVATLIKNPPGRHGKVDLHISGTRPDYACDTALQLGGQEVALKRKYSELSPALFALSTDWTKDIPLAHDVDSDVFCKKVLDNGNVVYVFKKQGPQTEAPPEVIRLG